MGFRVCALVKQARNFSQPPFFVSPVQVGWIAWPARGFYMEMFKNGKRINWKPMVIGYSGND